MSDLYLILRHRLDDMTMTDWVMIDTARLKEARKRLGLSYETVARNLHVSSKTYERYEKDGRVPRHLIDSVADVLELEIEHAQPARVKVADTWTQRETILDEIIRRLERIENLLNEKRAS